MGLDSRDYGGEMSETKEAWLCQICGDGILENSIGWYHVSFFGNPDGHEAIPNIDWDKFVEENAKRNRKDV